MSHLPELTHVHIAIHTHIHTDMHTYIHAYMQDAREIAVEALARACEAFPGNKNLLRITHRRKDGFVSAEGQDVAVGGLYVYVCVCVCVCLQRARM